MKPRKWVEILIPGPIEHSAGVYRCGDVLEVGVGTAAAWEADGTAKIVEPPSPDETLAAEKTEEQTETTETTETEETQTEVPDQTGNAGETGATAEVRNLTFAGGEV
jgi:hypothetical protein